ncbi:MAG: universal stress protein UspA [Actinomycetia bacterium]|nr:universal stress protein UspA [Actinomycetes bacterium]
MAEGLGLIVVGVDESETARAAAETAARLARLAGARLHVVTALASIASERIAGPGTDEFYVDDAETARTFLEGVAAAWPDLDVSVEVGEGKPGEVVVEEARRLGADLIVVGNRRVQGVSRVLGSVASDVARHASCDVYIAHTVGR